MEKQKYPYGYIPENGERFGKWEVTDNSVILVGVNLRKSRALTCKCDCGKEKIVRILALLEGKSTSCPCAGGDRKKRKAMEAAVGNLSKTQFFYYQHTAQRRDISWEISMQFLWDLLVSQNHKCALSGLPLILELKVDKSNTASVDRIDSTKGYVEGNVQWVHKDINKMKSNYTDAYFIEMCKYVAKNN